MPKPNDPRHSSTSRPDSAGGGAIDEARMAALLALIPDVAAALRAAPDRESMTGALAPILGLSAAEQEALATALGKLRGAEGAAAIDVAEAWSELGTVRLATKEASRATIRLHTAGLRPTIHVPHARSVVAPLAPLTTRAPELAGAWATQSREASEVVLLMAWKRPDDPDEWQGYQFVIDFWQGGINDITVMRPYTARQFEREVLVKFRHDLESKVASVTLGQARALLEEGLDHITWRKQELPHEWSTIDALLRARVFRDEVVPDPTVTARLIDPEVEPDELMVNFWSAWAFGDYNLVYELLGARHVSRERETREDFIALRRQWYEEAHPARVRIGAVAQQTQEQSGLWVPNAALNAGRVNWSLFWSLEAQETPIAGQLAEMPLATLISPINGRRWLWLSMTLERDPDQKRWRISRIRDEAVSAQGRPIEELLKRSDEIWAEADREAQESSIDQKEDIAREKALHIMSLAQESLSQGEAALMRLPADRALHEKLIEHARQTSMFDRAAAQTERVITRFGETALLRRDLTTLAFSQAQSQERQGDGAGTLFWMDQATTNARRSAELDRTAESLAILAEMLISQEEGEDEAEALLRESIAIHETVAAWADLGDLLMRKQESVAGVEAFERAQRLDPNTPQIRWRLGRALELVDRIPEARLVYEDAIERDPNDAMAHALLGNLSFQADDYADAGTHLEQALRLGMVTPQVLTQLAEVEANRGQLNRARILLDQAAQLDPRLADEVRQISARLRDDETKQRKRR